MSESQPVPTEDQRIHDIDLAWDMAYAAKPHWEAAREAQEAAEAAQDAIYHNSVKHTEEDILKAAKPETELNTETLREWVHKYKFLAHGTLDAQQTPNDKILDIVSLSEKGPLGFKTLGTMPKQFLDYFKSLRTPGGQYEQERSMKRFSDQDATEILTILTLGTSPEKNLYKIIDPNTDKPEERMVAVTYERENIRDGMGRRGYYNFTIVLPQSDAKVFSEVVTNKPEVARNLVDIAMAEELNLGDAWNGPNGQANTPRGSKLAIRTDFTQGPDESLIVPFTDAA